MKDTYLVSYQFDHEYYCVTCNADIREESIMIPPKYVTLLEANIGDTVRVAPYSYKK
jgi:arginine/ornithine N-succinyltransferase beta subunit